MVEMGKRQDYMTEVEKPALEAKEAAQAEFDKVPTPSCETIIKFLQHKTFLGMAIYRTRNLRYIY